MRPPPRQLEQFRRERRSELLIGVALIVGLFTGLAAFGGALLNFNFLLAGTASTNPVLFILAIALILAWKVAGHYGLDRFVLPALGTLWQVGSLITPVVDRVAVPLAGPTIRPA